MSLVGWILVGLLAGWLARWIVKDDRAGCIYTTVVGVVVPPPATAARAHCSGVRL